MGFFGGHARLLGIQADSARLVASEAERALVLDPQNVDALLAQFFDIPPSDSSSKPTRSWPV